MARRSTPCRSASPTRPARPPGSRAARGLVMASIVPSPQSKRHAIVATTSASAPRPG
jgi:hypothetical protein